MDSILKEAMRAEVSDVIEQIEAIVYKYGSSEDIVYTIAVGYVEEADEDANKWNVQYGYNCKNSDEFAEFMVLQTHAYSMSEDEEAEDDDGFLGYSLN